MEYTSTAPIADRRHARGRYESLPTDTAYLAGELASPQDITRLIPDFDRGLTPVRDIGGMFTAQRTAILEAYEEGTIDNLVTNYPEIVSTPVANLHQRIFSERDNQPVGHNFFVNATGFLDAGLPWATQFDALFHSRTGVSLYDIADSEDIAEKDRLFTTMTDNPDPELMTALAVYLAGRSLEGERYLEQQYGTILEQAKGEVFETIQNIGATTGLSVAMLERAAGQLQRTTFGSLDHLQRLVTSDNTGTAGDYLRGTLRISIQFEGSVQAAKLRTASDARRIIVHEVHHAGSAQTDKRCGLQVNKQGLEVNEGMTEYLAQLSTGGPGIEQLANGGLSIRRDVPYREPVFAVLALHQQFITGKNNHFAILFNAYHGDTVSEQQLEEALDAFYELDDIFTA